ncbi:hypothetical protein N7452_005214 [Penicillium brevicompactum]|uniref:Alpha/beta hydrolase fold-3 domain-containing protein n=1 Tax=Penicillium brevicompactum TaxID=5074 RepID=A0A9W9QID1_PENBR|nr:hypothetical protein N7452_005214 [Penicillium brevicompactum]
MVNTHPRDLQSILPSTIETYNAWVSSHNIAHTVDFLEADDSTRLLWIGPRKAKYVVLFFHGGGYAMPLSKGHLDWMAHVRNEAINAGVELSLLTHNGDLIPENRYPRQMSQGILALEHLLNSGYEPSQVTMVYIKLTTCGSNIVVGGDSAGGHLSLSLIAHLHHPRFEDCPTRNLLSQSGAVRGCFLVSPLASFNFNTPSYNRWLSADVLRGFRRKRLGVALDVPESWWNGFDAVDRVLVTGGSEEVFSDHIQRLAQMLKRKSNGNVTLYMGNEAHDGPLMDFLAGKLPSQTTKTITEFVISCFRK